VVVSAKVSLPAPLARLISVDAFHKKSVHFASWRRVYSGGKWFAHLSQSVAGFYPKSRKLSNRWPDLFWPQTFARRTDPRDLLPCEAAGCRYTMASAGRWCV
jgi:hypothetical protein